MTDTERSEQGHEHAALPYREEAIRYSAERHMPAEGLPDAIPVWIRIGLWLLALPILLGIAAFAMHGFRLPPLSGGSP